MARSRRNQGESGIPKEVENNIAESGLVEPVRQERPPPMYQIIGTESKIPVAKSAGSLWKSRRDAAVRKRKARGTEAAWDEAIAYYANDQSTGGRDPTRSNPEGTTRKIRDDFSETENVVFSNVNALVPMVYAKHPQVEFTGTRTGDVELERQATVVEALVNTLAEQKAAPGFNFKPKEKRAVINATLTNAGWIEIGYTKKDQSSEEALQQIVTLSQEYAKAKDAKQIRKIEGQLMALEERIDLLRPSGPWAKFRRPQQIMVDPESEEDDLTDARWVMCWEYVSTAWLKAVYGKDKNGEFESLYKPTHIIPANTESTVEDDVNSFSLFEEDDGSADYKKFGYDDEEAFRKAQVTKVYRVWDKVTRRVFLYSDASWTWPLWVWDDPYNIDTFFPYYKLCFYMNPVPGEGKGETSYYLDQQDAINEINDEESRARHWVRKNVFFDKNRISEADVEEVLHGPDGTARGIDLPEGMTLNDVIFTFKPPSMDFPTLFNKQAKYEAIGRISSVTDVMRGAEFKTNTTNRAVDTYNSISSTAADAKIDAVEDHIGSVMWGVAQMCMQFMSVEQVAALIGPERAQGWQQLQPDEIHNGFSVSVAGGSTLKPTSRAKKEEATEVAQTLGQFASVTPLAVVVALQVLERAFDEVVISEEEWKQLRESVMSQIGIGQGQPPQQGQEDPAQGAQGLEQILSQLPPELQEAVMKAIDQGVPPEQAVQKVVEIAERGQGV